MNLIFTETVFLRNRLSIFSIGMWKLEDGALMRNMF